MIAKGSAVMISYKTLENTSIEVLQQAFVKAFSDYQVKIDMPVSKLALMLKRRGYDPEISIGAFDDEMLVGFVLNGLRNWNGEQTAYDTGTGVIREYRKQGITSRMISNTMKLFDKNGISQYLLEVIQANTAALRLYQKQGFKISRDLLCFQIDRDKYEPAASYKTERIDNIDQTLWTQLKAFWDVKPSWQNSIDSINAVQDAFLYSIIHIDGKIAGYGIIEKATGDIPQLAVDKDYRHRKVASSILADLIKSTESNKISILNVDGKYETAKDFLLKQGFQSYVDQYEMILKL